MEEFGESIRAVVQGAKSFAAQILAASKSTAETMKDIARSLESIEKHLDDMNGRDYRRDL